MLPGSMAGNEIVCSLQRLDSGEVQQNWTESVQNVAQLLTPEQNLDVQAGALQCVCSVLLPSASHHQLPPLLSSLSQPVEGVFASATERCAKALGTARGEDDSSEQVARASSFCQFLQGGVVSLLGGYQAVRGRVGSEGESPSGLLALSSMCVTVMKTTLAFCKEVETEHSWAFNLLASHLGALFKSTYSLLKVCAESVATLPLNQYTTEDSLKNLLCRLQALCRVVLTFDPSLLVLVWKALSKLVCRSKRLLRRGEGERWSVRGLIGDLCTALETKAKECVQCAPTSDSSEEVGGGGAFSKLLRVCRFLVTLLVKLVEEFEASSYEYAGELVALLLNVHSSLPPSPHAPPVSTNAATELESNILLLREPLMSSLLGCQPFLRLLTTSTPPPLSPTPLTDSGYARAVCLCTLMKLFPKLPEGVQDYLMEPDSSSEASASHCRLLDAVFTATETSYVEHQLPVCVPGVMCNGQPQSEVTLYEHTATHLCVLVATLPQRHLPRMESALLRHLLGTHLASSLLAADVWCFLVQRAPEELALHHTHLLARVLLSLPESPSPAYLTLCSLVGRMVALLAPEKQVEFVQMFPPSTPTHLKLWAHLRVEVYTGTLQSEVCRQLTTTCLQVLRENGGTNPHGLHLALRGLAVVYALSPSCLPPPLHNATVGATMQVWGSVAKQSLSDRNKLQAAVVCDVLRLTSLMLAVLSPQHTLKVFGSLQGLVSQGAPPSVALAAASFLSHCKALQVPPGIQSPVLRLLTSLFLSLLPHPHWLVHHHAMEAFRTFAEVTPYAEAVEQCIPSELHDTVIHFLNKDPGLMQPSFLSELLLQRRHHLRRLRERHTATSAQGQECNGADGVNELLSLLRSTWEQLQSHPHPLPPPALTELDALVHSMGEFLADHHAHMQ